MVSIINKTNFPHLRFSHSDKEGREFGVMILKCTYDINENGECFISKEQEPFNFYDACYEDVNTSSLQYPSDLAAFKPKTDFVLNAIAYAPSADQTNQFICGFTFSHNHKEIVSKDLRVLGKRFWRPLWKRSLNENEQKEWQHYKDDFKEWQLTEAEPVTSLPIRYEYAFGGETVKGVNENNENIIEAYQYNPLGRGWLDRQWSSHIEEHLAPQIESLNAPVIEPYISYDTASFGAIPAHWLPRRLLGGTYDQAWLDNVRPKWPRDYDENFNNSAPHDQQLSLIQKGSININLRNLRKNKKNFSLSFNIPNISFSYSTENEIQSYLPNIDMILVDVSSDDLFDCRVILTFRASFDLFNTQAILIKEHFDNDPNYQNLEPIPHPEYFAVLSNRLEKSE